MTVIPVPYVYLTSEIKFINNDINNEVALMSCKQSRGWKKNELTAGVAEDIWSSAMVGLIVSMTAAVNHLYPMSINSIDENKTTTRTAHMSKTYIKLVYLPKANYSTVNLTHSETTTNLYILCHLHIDH